METIRDRIGKIDHKLRQVGGKMSLLKRQNMQLLAENVRLKKQLEKNKNNNFVNNKLENRGEREEEIKTNADGNGEEVEKLKSELDHYIEQLGECIEDLEKL
ncbi:hypothetical protein [Membranihabitans maritimus]|uniref:hypothetical protein n=1 Tax=Membranihabitans maritimus TaxID=2904244 RepID=UPI001F37153D|nr:hypothetical protein [Membranihabitans maritimus]